MRQIKITVTVQQEGQIRKYADSEYRYLIEVEGEFPQDKVLRFCRSCLNGGGIAYDEWSNDNGILHSENKKTNFSTYFNGYYTFDKLTEEKDSRGIVTKANYAYKVVIPYCD